MNKKDLKKDTLIKVGILIAIIVVVNYISNQYYTRFDLTKNKTYTLSNISRNVVDSLDDQMVVKAYFSDNLPSPYNNLRRETQNLLDDYRSFSDGKFNYELINPAPTGEGETSDDALQKEAQKYGIQPVQLRVSDKDKYEVKNVYLGLVFLYEGKQEAIPVVQSVDNLEYQVTSAIKKLVTEKKKKIGFLQGHGEQDLSKYQQINGALTQQYDVVPVDVAGFKPVPEDVDVLLVLAPTAPFPEAHKFMLDQYVMRGGNIAWCINKVVPNFQQQIVLGEPVNTGLDDMLLNYGIKINNDLIRDIQCSQVNVQSQIGIPIPVNYPYFPMIKNINQSVPAFQNLQSVVLTFASSLDTLPAVGKAVVQPLLVSSDRSGKAEGFFILNLEQFQELTQKGADTLFNMKGLLAGASYTGNFKSFYAGKTPPSDTIPGSLPYSGPVINDATGESKMVVIGDGDFMNEANRPPTENLIFFINMVEYLADDIGLSEIRSKVSAEAPIGEVSDGTKNFLKYFNLLFPSVLVLLIGLYRWKKRASRRKSLQS